MIDTDTMNHRPERVPMDSLRKTALVGGVLYLITFIFSIPGIFLSAPCWTTRDYILGSGADSQVLLGALLRHRSPPSPASAPPSRCTRW